MSAVGRAVSNGPRVASHERPTWLPQRRPAIDSLAGKDGDDEIRGLGGEDLLFGNPGDDYVPCGHGHDEVFADRADEYGGDCERVHLP